MKPKELEAIKALKPEDKQEYLISIGTSDVQTVSLNEDMTMKEFKSFLLTMTGNEPFNLDYLVSNERTLK